MANLPQRVPHTRIARPARDDDAAWRTAARVEDDQRRRDAALRAEGRQQAWATVLVLMGLGALVTMGLRSPGTALLALVVLVYGLMVAARSTRVRSRRSR